MKMREPHLRSREKTFLGPNCGNNWMSYTVIVRPAARKFLEKLRDACLYGRLRQAIDGLATVPRPKGFVHLAAAEDLCRIRVGDYRIIYQIQDQALVVLVVKIGHRREIYRQ